MNEDDLFAPLLQLNPPVLVRTDGNLTVTDLAALRRGNAGASAVVGGSPHNPTPFASLAARKLHDAKSTARQVSRSGELPPRAHTTELPGQRKTTNRLHQTSQQHASAASSTTHGAGLRSGAGAADQALYGATGSAPPSPSAAGGAATAAATPTAGSYFGGSDTYGTSEPITAIATAASTATVAGSGGPASDESLSLNLPYLMRHTQDTGALLDTLFPLHMVRNESQSNNPNNAPYNGPSALASPTALISVQTVSAAPTPREAVMALHAALRARLEARRARPTGLCDIRRAIYTDLFSELVRQVTVEEPARGLLLARVRENDEHALRVHAGLLREGENFVVGKLLQDTHDVAALTERLAQLRREKTQLEVRRHDLQDARQELERRFEEQRATRRAQQQDELNYLRRANQQLSLRLKMETERASAGGGGGGAGATTGGTGAEDGAAAAANTAAASAAAS